MGRRVSLFGLAALALVVLSGCATPWAVDSYEPPDGNVASRQTWFWKGGEFGTPASIDPQLVADATARMREAVTVELGRRGYTEVTSVAEADMQVSFQVAGTQRFELADTRRIGAPSANQVLRPGATQPPPASALPREMSIRDGSVLIYIEDRASGRLIWRGMVTAETRIGSPEHGVRVLTQMTQAIARQVPARAGAR
jgi:hypothetical protein